MYFNYNILKNEEYELVYKYIKITIWIFKFYNLLIDR